MYLFKTSGETFKSVIKNQKHAFRGQPTDWHQGEIVLVSKNKCDLGRNEKQISYVMKIERFRPLSNAECEEYWPGNYGRWNWIVDCCETKELVKAFNLNVVIGAEAARKFNSVMTFRKLERESEEKVLAYIQNKQR